MIRKTVQTLKQVQNEKDAEEIAETTASARRLPPRHWTPRSSVVAIRGEAQQTNGRIMELEELHAQRHK